MCMHARFLRDQRSELRGLESIARAVSRHHNILAFFNKVNKTLMHTAIQQRQRRSWQSCIVTKVQIAAKGRTTAKTEDRGRGKKHCKRLTYCSNVTRPMIARKENALHLAGKSAGPSRRRQTKRKRRSEVKREGMRGRKSKRSRSRKKQ